MTSCERGPSPSGRWRRPAVSLTAVLAGSVFAAIFYFNAYVCDDAFISFRSVDNLFRGHGLRWNVDERVQVFTSPLFTLLFAAFYSFVRDASEVPNPDRAYWLAILLSFAISALALHRVLRGRGAAGWLAFVTLMSSQAFVTFTSSGLETPLSYLIVAVFYAAFLRTGFLARERDLLFGFACAAFALLNRLDLVVLFLPALVYMLVSGARRFGRRAVALALLGLSPALLWAGFAVFYFGFALPNSYYAKLGLDAPRSVLTGMGAAYLEGSVRQDPVTLLVCLAGVALCWSDARSRLAGLAIALQLSYVVAIGGDFLGFRFLAPPFLLAVILLSDRLAKREELPGPLRTRVYAVAAGLAYGLLLPSSPLRAFNDPPAARDVSYYYRASGLARWRPGMRFPFARFLRVRDADDCRRMYARVPSVAVPANGLSAFCRGPQARLVDPYGITDPLMARISVPISGPFKPAHVAKPVPVGYPESLLLGENHIVDEELRAFYDRLRLVVAAPLWTRARWRAIGAMNLPGGARYRRTYVSFPPPD